MAKRRVEMAPAFPPSMQTKRKIDDMLALPPRQKNSISLKSFFLKPRIIRLPIDSTPAAGGRVDSTPAAGESAWNKHSDKKSVKWTKYITMEPRD